MKKLVTLIVFCLALNSIGFAQKCGTAIADLHAMGQHIFELKQQHELWGNVGERRNVTRYVPVTVHLVANTAMVGRVSEIRILELFCEINKNFEEQGVEIQFWIKRFNYINKDAVFNTPNSSAGEFQSNLQKKNDSANIFFVNDIPDGSGGIGGTILAYYQPGSDWFV